MPKRRMTPARKAQIKKWQLAGQKARQSATRKMILSVDKPYRIPMGKTPLLYHNTTAARADLIVKQQVWKPMVNHGVGAKPTRNVFFRQPTAKDNWEYYGKAIVGVKVPRKFIRKERGSSFGYSHMTYTVDKRHLRGREVRRIK